MPLPFSYLLLPLVVAVVVIARGSLSPRGNSETDKAFALVVVVPSPLAGEGGSPKGNTVRGSPFLVMPLPFSYLSLPLVVAVVVIASGRFVAPRQSRN
jgi:hypothetical protein